MIVAPNTLVQNRFRIIRQIGQGKMGAVYEAFDENLSQTVALKQTLTSGDQFSKAFEREARILASLRHPVLPIVIDHFTNENGQFMVMDFIPGKDLGELLRQRGDPFPVHVVLKWADQVLHALEYLHRQKPPIIHRDIKPQNLKLTAEGQIILLDFGLAKGRIMPDARDYQLPTAQKMLSLVATGTVETDTQEFSTDIFGFTRQYAPPEQIQGTGTDARSDIYALAATLYQLLTGAPPTEALKRINELGYDNYSHYEAGLEKLRIHLEQRQIVHDDVTKHEQLLRENIELARLYGDNPTSQETRSATIDHLDALTRDILGLSFNKLCRLDIPFSEQYSQTSRYNTPYDPLVPVHDVNPAVPTEIGIILHQALALTPDYRPASAEAMRTKLLTAQRAIQQTTHSPDTSDDSNYTADPFLPPHPEPPEPGGFESTRKSNKSVGLLIAIIVIILIAQIYLVVANRQKISAPHSETNTLGHLAYVGIPASDVQDTRGTKGIVPMSQQTAMYNDQTYIIQTYQRPPFILEYGNGVYLYDTTNTPYLDFVAGIGVNALGYGDSDIIAAITKQAARLIHVSNLYHTQPGPDLAKLLIQNSPGFDRVFFCNSGSEAVEGSLKFARKYARQNYGEGKTTIIAFEGSFHGRTMGAVATTSREKYRLPFMPVMPDVCFVPLNDSAAFDATIGDNVCAVIIEPVQGEGGLHEASDDFLVHIRERCDTYAALMIVDEIQCGMGRTGTLWAHQSSGVQPDIMTVAKPLGAGMPIGAILVQQHVADALVVGDHGTTFGGGPLVTAVAQVVLRRISDSLFLDQVRDVATYLEQALHTLAADKPDTVLELRGRGLMRGIRINGSATAVRHACHDAGLLVATAGEDVIRLLPPLIIEQQHVDEAMEKLSRVL